MLTKGDPRQIVGATPNPFGLAFHTERLRKALLLTNSNSSKYNSVGNVNVRTRTNIGKGILKGVGREQNEQNHPAQRVLSPVYQDSALKPRFVTSKIQN
jgi:hypothetical protein